jgi:putative ABC transport system permease protein
LPGSESAIVNQRLASLFFPNEDPIGHQICLTASNGAATLSPACVTIVGVSPTVRQQYFQEIDPVVYVPAPTDASELTLIVRSHSTPDAVAPLIRAEVFALDDDIALNALLPLDQAMTQSRWGHRVSGGC